MASPPRCRIVLIWCWKALSCLTVPPLLWMSESVRTWRLSQGWLYDYRATEQTHTHTLLNRNTKYSIRLFLLHSICTTTEDANQISLYLYNYGRKIKVFLFQDNRDCPRGFSPRSSSVSVQFQIHETLIGIFMRTSCLFLLGILLLCAIIQSNTYPTPPSEWESQWFWPWHDCWCQMGLFEYFRDCWSSGNFTHRSL